MLEKGQKVRLNAQGRRFYEKRLARSRVIDWKLRLGTIGRISRDRKRASILWEDNKTLCEPLPLMFLETIEKAAEEVICTPATVLVVDASKTLRDK